MPAERWWFDPMHAAWEWRGAGWWWLDPMYAAWEWRGAGWWRRRVGGDVSSELGMDLDLAVVSQEAVDGDFGLERVGGMPPLQFRLGVLSIAHNHGYRGWWML